LDVSRHLVEAHELLQLGAQGDGADLVRVRLRGRSRGSGRIRVRIGLRVRVRVGVGVRVGVRVKVRVRGRKMARTMQTTRRRSIRNLANRSCGLHLE